MMPTDHRDETVLPDSVQAMLREGRDETGSEDLAQKFASVAGVLRDDRKRCIEGRMTSGIEDVWRKCEDNYATIDEVTGQSAAVMRPRFHKPPVMDVPLRSEASMVASSKSTAFERLTARYVDAAKAKVCSILLASNAKSFGMKETPDPDLIKAKADLQQIVINGVGLQRDPTPSEYLPPNPTDPLTPLPGNPAQPPSSLPGVPLTPKNLAEEKIAEGHSKAQKAETIVYDWMKEGKYVRQMRRVVHDAAKLGVGILKGPFPEMRRGKAVTKLDDKKTVALQVESSLKPGFKAISPWDFFPDPDCVEDIHSGRGCWERDYLAERQLKDCADLPGYFRDEITTVIAEGPGAKEAAGEREPEKYVLKDTRFEVWYYTGWLTQDEVQTLNQYMALPEKDPALLPEDDAAVSVVVTMVNDHLIRCTMNGLEKSGHVPYHVLPWTPRAGSWTGVGVGEQIFMPQELVNAATRQMINNAGVSAGSQIVMSESLVLPATKNDYTIHADKLWFLKSDALLTDIKQVFGVFAIPNCTPQMLSIIVHAYQVAENSCNIPLVSQGLSGASSPATLGQTELQNSNANQLLRDVAANFDDCLVEPLVEDLYEWLLLDPDIDDEAKGDFQIDASGSSALMARAIQAQFLAQQGAIVGNPAFGCNPKKWYAEVLKSQHLDPGDIQYSKEEQEKISQAPPPKAPQVEAAQIRSEAALQLGKMNVDRDTEFVGVEKEKTQLDHQLRMQELDRHERLELLKYANQRQISLEQVKADLAETTMRLQTQKELAAAANILDAHKHSVPQAENPPTEPQGRAETGRAFEQ